MIVVTRVFVTLGPSYRAVGPEGCIENYLRLDLIFNCIIFLMVYILILFSILKHSLIANEIFVAFSNLKVTQ